MSTGDTTPRKSNDLDFLKSIVGDDRPGSRISRIDEETDEDKSIAHFSLPNSKASYSNRDKDSSNGDKQTNPRSHTMEDNKNLYNPNVSLRRQIEIDLENYKAKQNRTEMWARGDLDDSQLDNNEYNKKRVSKKPPRPRSSTRPQSSYQVIVDPIAHRLERKYSELKQLLQGTRPEESPMPNTDLIHLATKMARKYQMESLGLVPGSVASKRHRFPDLLNGSGDVDNRFISSPRSDQDEYILIDGTGSMVRTTKVRFIPERQQSAGTQVNGTPRGRTRARRATSAKKPPPAKAWGSKTNSQASSQKSTPRKASPKSSRSRSSSSRSRSSPKGKSKNNKAKTTYYSDSFDSDSSSSRSRSPSPKSKGKTVDLHLKYTKNEKLLEWLQQKDKLYKEQKRKERKERKEKRKAKKLEAEEKQKLKEKSDAKVKEWMKKHSGTRLLRRERMKGMHGQTESAEDLVVIDEMLDLREHGAKVDPSQVPEEVMKKIDEQAEDGNKEVDEGNIDSTPERSDAPENAKSPTGTAESKPPSKGRAKGRPQSATNVPFTRPVSGRRGRFSEGAKEKVRQHKEKVLKEQEEENKKRISYDEWLKTKRDSSAKGVKIADASKKEESAKATEATKVKHDGNASKPTVEENGKHVIRGVDSKVRPKSGKPKVNSQTPTPPSKPKPAATIAAVPKPQQSESTPGPPTPEFDKGKPYKAVKNEQKSWDNFADHVWKDVNKEEEMDGDRNMDRPEPQGSDAPDDLVAKNGDHLTSEASKADEPEMTETEKADMKGTEKAEPGKTAETGLDVIEEKSETDSVKQESNSPTDVEKDNTNKAEDQPDDPQATDTAAESQRKDTSGEREAVDDSKEAKADTTTTDAKEEDSKEGSTEEQKSETEAKESSPDKDQAGSDDDMADPMSVTKDMLMDDLAPEEKTFITASGGEDEW